MRRRSRGALSSSLAAALAACCCPARGDAAAAAGAPVVRRGDVDGPGQNAGSPCANGDVRLDMYPTGVPEIWWDGDWHPVCGFFFWDNDAGASLVCQKMGYTNGSKLYPTNVSNPAHPNGVPWANATYGVDAFRMGGCLDNDTSLLDCHGGCNDYKVGGVCSSASHQHCSADCCHNMVFVACHGDGNAQATCGVAPPGPPPVPPSPPPSPPPRPPRPPAPPAWHVALPAAAGAAVGVAICVAALCKLSALPHAVAFHRVASEPEPELDPGSETAGAPAPEAIAAAAFRDAYVKLFKEELPAPDFVDVMIVPGDERTRGYPQHIVQLVVGSQARERARGKAVTLKNRYCNEFKKRGGDPRVYFHIG